jgi:DNA polymerase elongation subunit (family B)
MKAAIKIFLLIFIMTISCDMNTRLSTTELAEQVQVSMIETWEDQEIEGLQVKSLILVHKSDNEYSGVLKTIEEEYSYTVSVVYDGEHFSWEILD